VARLAPFFSRIAAAETARDSVTLVKIYTNQANTWLEKLKNISAAKTNEQVVGYVEQTEAELAREAGNITFAQRIFTKKMTDFAEKRHRNDAARMAFYLGEIENNAQKPAAALLFFEKAIGFLTLNSEKKTQLASSEWSAKTCFAQADAFAKTGNFRASVQASIRGFEVLGAMRRRAVSENAKFRLADEQRKFCEAAMPVAQTFFE
jgi:hypothetical protein